MTRAARAPWPGSGGAHPSAGAINSHPVGTGRSAALNGRAAATTPAATRRNHTSLAAAEPAPEAGSPFNFVNIPRPRQQGDQLTADHRGATAPSLTTAGMTP
jgi:hypothetical protein